MKVLCICASNTRLGKESASRKVCELIKEEINDNENISILALSDYDIIPCKLCGNCYHDQKCPYDEHFNLIYESIINSDAIFIVCPHYSPIPSKLIILMEKINQIVYASMIHNPNFISPTKKIRVGIIGHGGMTENDQVLKYYHDYLISIVANTLRSLGFNVIGENEIYKNGTVFGLVSDDCLVKKENKIFPDIIHDYVKIKERIKPLINKVIEKGVN